MSERNDIFHDIEDLGPKSTTRALPLAKTLYNVHVIVLLWNKEKIQCQIHSFPSIKMAQFSMPADHLFQMREQKCQIITQIGKYTTKPTQKYTYHWWRLWTILINLGCRVLSLDFATNVCYETCQASLSKIARAYSRPNRCQAPHQTGKANLNTSTNNHHIIILIIINLIKSSSSKLDYTADQTYCH